MTFRKFVILTREKEATDIAFSVVLFRHAETEEYTFLYHDIPRFRREEEGRPT